MRGGAKRPRGTDNEAEGHEEEDGEEEELQTSAQCVEEMSSAQASGAEHVSEKRIGKRRAKRKSGGARQRRAQRKDEGDEPEEMGEEEC